MYNDVFGNIYEQVKKQKKNNFIIIDTKKKKGIN